MNRSGGRQGPSLRTVADSLASSYSRTQKPNRNVTVKSENPADRLRPGRHQCDCQARIHGLVRNCMACGRIVCEQEGSGPCFFCGELVCTREEREIINRKSKKSVELYNKLMGANVQRDGKEANAFSLASVGTALAKAEEYRNKLLEADADTERRTRVNDLESDYYSMENNAYLTKEEREAIIARKRELKELRAREKMALFVDINIANRTVTESKAKQVDAAKDPVIQNILEKALHRQPNSGATVQRSEWLPESFVPRYDSRIGRRFTNLPGEENPGDDDDSLYPDNDEMMHAEVERKGYAIALPQPIASLLARGIRRHVPWQEEIYLRGPLLIASNGVCVAQREVDDELARCRQRAFENNQGFSREFPLEYPAGAIVGRALLSDCLTRAEYASQYPRGECLNCAEEFVLMFSVFEPLLVCIPHLPPSKDLYRVDKQFRAAIKRILDPYGFS